MRQIVDREGSERVLAAGMDGDVVAEVDARLDLIERDHGVRILLAVESGSRAWGFPSPDSDYDCRFVYLRPRDDYLRLYPKRDVIETELTPVLDVNGWDLQKALKLLLKGNAVIVEWLTSPIVYRAQPGVREAFIALARDTADRDRTAQHYLHLAERQRGLSFDHTGEVRLKKLFYTLRPAIALRWMRLHPNARIAPMHFPTLCLESELSAQLLDEITALLDKKAITRELGSGEIPKAIAEIIEVEINLAAQLPKDVQPPSEESVRRADTFFLRMLGEFGGDTAS